MPRLPSSPYMIVIVSTKTLRARDPDHRAMTKPMEITSGLLAAEDVVDQGPHQLVDALVGQYGRRRVEDVAADVVDRVGADDPVDVADGADEAQQQRRK